MNTNTTTTTDAPMTAQDSPDLDAMTLEELQAEERRAENAFNDAKREHFRHGCMTDRERETAGEMNAARDYRDNVTFHRQEKQYGIQRVTIKETGKDKLRFSFTATRALLELLKLDADFDEITPEEALRLAILKEVFDTERRLEAREAT